MPHTVLTEENLRRILNDGTIRLNLEASYWLKNSFLEKIGRLCPNLQELSLRRMKDISNNSFAEIFNWTKNLRVIDLADCEGLHCSALHLLLDKNKEIEELQLAGCIHAVDNTSIRLIAGLQHITFLDISYTKLVTDHGLVHFGDKKLPLTTLALNSVTSISSVGLSVLIMSCSSTLLHLEAAYNDQDTMKSDLFLKLGQCWNLEVLDVSGCRHLDDSAINNLLKAEQPSKEEGQPSLHPGLKYLNTVRMINLNIGDYSLMNLAKVSPNLEQVEIASCQKITDFGLK